MSVVPTIITIVNTTNSTTETENPSHLQLEMYIALLVLASLVGLSLLIGIHECATKHGYNNFVHCIVCESIGLLLICFLGETTTMKIINCGRRAPDTTRQRTYSDTSSEYSDHEIPEIMFETEVPQLYLEDDEKICSICCEELGNSINDEDISTLVKLECGHYYHSKCIEQWYNTSKNKDCPMCKKDIKIEDYYFT